jgi:hypothetical protein
MEHLDELLAWDDVRRSEWLLANQPVDESMRTNWWLSLIGPLGSSVTGDVTRGDVLERARLGVIMLDLALETGALDAREVANRIAWLSLAVHEAGLTGVPEGLTADTAVRRSLAVVDLRPEEAERMAADWPARSREEMLRLRVAKNVLRPLDALVDYVADSGLRAEVRQWLALSPLLP